MTYFGKAQEFSMEEMNKFSISSLITRTTNDVTQVEMLIAMGLGLIVKAPITAVWAIMKILGKSFAWSPITGGAVLILLITIQSLKTLKKMLSQISLYNPLFHKHIICKTPIILIISFFVVKNQYILIFFANNTIKNQI